MRAHCASPCSNMGFHQKPAGSGGGGAAGAAPLVMSCAHDLAPSSSWRFHISKSCWDGDGSVMVHLWGPGGAPGQSRHGEGKPLRRMGGQPGRDLRPAVGSCPAASDQRDVSTGQLDILLV